MEEEEEVEKPNTGMCLAFLLWRSLCRSASLSLARALSRYYYFRLLGDESPSAAIIANFVTDDNC